MLYPQGPAKSQVFPRCSVNICRIGPVKWWLVCLSFWAHLPDREGQEMTSFNTYCVYLHPLLCTSHYFILRTAPISTDGSILTDGRKVRLLQRLNSSWVMKPGLPSKAQVLSRPHSFWSGRTQRRGSWMGGATRQECCAGIFFRCSTLSTKTLPRCFQTLASLQSKREEWSHTCRRAELSSLTSLDSAF